MAARTRKPGTLSGIAEARPDMVWRGDRLGAQLHVGSAELSAARFISIRSPGMAKLRAGHQPLGGTWTARLLPGPSSAFTEGASRLRWERRAWWQLEPNPACSVLAIDSADDLAAALARYPNRSGANLDFVSIAHDGFAAVHATERGAALPAMSAWGHESTLWLAWAFVGPPIRLDPPPGYATEPPLPVDAPPLLPGTSREAVTGWGAPEGLWIDLRAAFSPTFATIYHRLQADRDRLLNGAGLPEDLRDTFDIIADLYAGEAYRDQRHREVAFLSDAVDVEAIDDRVARHNLIDDEGNAFPVGTGLGARLLLHDHLFFHAVATAVRRA